MTDTPEELWISFTETVKLAGPADYWPNGWPTVFKKKRDSGVKYIRADVVEELRAKAAAFDEIVAAKEGAIGGEWGPGPYYLDVQATYQHAGNIWTMKLFDVRGWGHLTGKGHARKLTDEAAKKIQVANADFITTAANVAERFTSRGKG